MSWNIMNGIKIKLLTLLLTSTTFADKAPNVQIDGELKLWHNIELTLDGPESSETADPNPFLDYRMDVEFVHGNSNTRFLIPGYFAADGNAANSGASKGHKWRAHLAPNQIGKWTYKINFHHGPKAAVTAATKSASLKPFDGLTGEFQVEESDKARPDFRAKGRLEYVGKKYYQFSGSKDYFLKQGADSPENLLAYTDFDGTQNSDKIADRFIKKYKPHIADWNHEDPTWGQGKGKGLIGAINYLASEGLNGLSCLTMNIGGDDKNVFPYISSTELLRMDCSKLDQWAIVFEHASNKGFFFDFKTQESENETLLDDGDVGPQRKLYYRELIARFGYNLGLQWNLGEENGKWGYEGFTKDHYQTTAQRIAMAEYFHKYDPYHNPIVIHPGQHATDLLGKASKLTGYSLQTGHVDFKWVPGATRKWVQESSNAGRPWVVFCDEPGDASWAIRHDNDAKNSHTMGRKNALWGHLLNGGAGCNYYFGYKNKASDLTLEDFRTRDAWWDYCRHALSFFHDNKIPFHEMSPNHDLTSNKDDWCLAKPGTTYIVYLKNGGSTDLDLSAHSGTFEIQWFNPRAGGDLQKGTVERVSGQGTHSLGRAPQEAESDWVILVRMNNAAELN